MDRQKYASLNGLRTISIGFVICHHLGLWNHVFDRFHGTWLSPVTTFLEMGNMGGALGVTVFFVISGFLITSLLIHENQSTGTVSLKDFYIRRTLRIFPAYYFLLFVYFIFRHFKLLYIPTAAWITAITYTKYFNPLLDWYTGHAWSLSVEEHFYLCWPLIFISGFALRKYFPFFLIVLVFPFRYYMHLHPDSKVINEFTLFTRVDAIAIGCLVALYRNKIVQVLGQHWNKYFLAAVAGMILLCYFPRAMNAIHLGPIGVILGATHGTIGCCFIAVIMLYAVFGPHGVVYKFLNLRVMEFLGVLSYSIYLWQQPFISGRSGWWFQFPQNVGCILVAALFSYYVIERPFLKLKSRFSKVETKPVPTAAATQ